MELSLWAADKAGGTVRPEAQCCFCCMCHPMCARRVAGRGRTLVYAHMYKGMLAWRCSVTPWANVALSCSDTVNGTKSDICIKSEKLPGYRLEPREDAKLFCQKKRMVKKRGVKIFSIKSCQWISPSMIYSRSKASKFFFFLTGHAPFCICLLT